MFRYVRDPSQSCELVVRHCSVLNVSTTLSMIASGAIPEPSSAAATAGAKAGTIRADPNAAIVNTRARPYPVFFILSSFGLKLTHTRMRPSYPNSSL